LEKCKKPIMGMRHLNDTHAKQQERQKGCDSDNAG